MTISMNEALKRPVEGVDKMEKGVEQAFSGQTLADKARTQKEMVVHLEYMGFLSHIEKVI